MFIYVIRPIFTGRFNEAMNAAKEITSNLPDDLLANPVMNKFFECFLSVEMHVLIRFGKWDEILSRPMPANPDVSMILYSNCIFHFFFQLLFFVCAFVTI